MKKQKRILTFILMLSLVFTGILVTSEMAYAGKITNMQTARKLAMKKVKKAVVTEVDKDYEKGILVYVVHLWRQTKEYELIYRASDGVLLSYSWEEMRINMTSRKKIMSKSTCQKLARKEVPQGKITSIAKKYDGRMYRYKVKMQKEGKNYFLEYHARTQKLLEYKWELRTFRGKDKHNYIGWKKAKKIALPSVPGAEAVKVELGKSRGIYVYRVELVKDRLKYQIEIHASTGEVLKIERIYK
ncbi:MAG: hypothetical protein HFI70_03300 [Lachnospiraceae bacterium]|nr:hypothetical protein [Lachnospiraceae bacterium]